MPTYAYECEKCDIEFEVIKPIREYDTDEFCKGCGNKSKKLVTAPSIFIGTKVEDAEYNVGLGCITKGRKHREELAKRKNLVELGNENPNTLHKNFEKQRAEKRKKSWDEV